MPTVAVNPGKQKQVFGRSAYQVTVPGVDAVGVFRECHGLEFSFDVLTYNEGGNNEFVHHFPSRIQYPPLVLVRGLTDEDALLRWVWQTRVKAERKEVTITLYDWSQQRQRAWTFADAFPVRWVGPRLSSHADDLAEETLEIVHGGLKLA
jgi:phage tail-like protein